MEPYFFKKYAEPAKYETYKENIQLFRESIQDLVETYKDQSYMKIALHNDHFVIRFLKARKNNVEKTVELFKECLEARVADDLDNILNEPNPSVRFLLNHYPQTFGGTDSEHRPIILDSIGDFNAVALTELSSNEELLRYHAYMQEFLQRKLLGESNYLCLDNFASQSQAVPEESEEKVSEVEPVEESKVDGKSQDVSVPESDVSPAAGPVHVDSINFLTSVKLAGLGHLKSVDFLKAIGKIDSIGYPELLHRTFIIHAGFVFKTAYAIAKPFLDAGTTDKFSIFRSDGSEEMHEELGIENLPSFFKGTKSFSHLINFKYTDVEKPEDADKYWVAPIEIVENTPENENRISELTALATAKNEQESMLMRMTSPHIVKLMYLAENGLTAYEEKYESERLEEIAKVRSGDALDKAYLL